MCGHATLAAGHILLTGAQVRFRTRSGVLTVGRNGDQLRLSLPASTIAQAEEPEALTALSVHGDVFRGVGGNGASGGSGGAADVHLSNGSIETGQALPSGSDVRPTTYLLSTLSDTGRVPSAPCTKRTR